MHGPRPRPLRSALLALCAGCLAAGLSTQPAQAAGTLTACTEGAPEGFDIVQYETIPTGDAAGLTLYDQLVAFKPGTTELAPGLAERWEISADGLGYTLFLRHGVKFHETPWFKPTRDFNADDVLWSINRLSDASHPAHDIAQNGYPYWAGMNLNTLFKSLEKIDDYTVRFVLTRPDAPFLADLTLNATASIYSAEYGEQLAKSGQLDRLNTQPVGTGPFIFKSYQKDAVIRYSANAAYWGGAPKIDNLIFAITPDPAVRAQRIKAGECVVASYIPADLAAPFEKDPKVAIVTSQPLTTSYIAPNAKHKYLSDPRFRQALSLAIDRAGFVRSVYAGRGTPAGSFLPPGIWSHDAAWKNPYDAEKARALVKASGYDGRELTLFATSRSSDIQRAVELLQADWAKVGVQVRVRMLELGELYKRTGKGEHDLALLSWYSDNGDPDNFFTPNLSCTAVAGGGNKGQWCNAAFDAQIDRARATTDPKQRTEAYLQAQRVLREDTGTIPLAYKQSVGLIARRVSGVQLTPFGGTDFRAARLN